MSTFSGLPAQIVSALSGLADQIGGVFTGMASTALQWGTGIITQITQGISGAASNLVGAVKGALGPLGNLLPHSPAKEGPLAENGGLATWGGNIPGELAKGVTSQAGRVRGAMLQMLKMRELQDTQMAARLGIDGGLSGSGGVGGGVAFAGAAAAHVQPIVIPVRLELAGRLLAEVVSTYQMQQHTLRGGSRR